MKRYSNLYTKIYDIDNIKLAHKNARKDKLHYHDVKMVDENPDYYLNKISAELCLNLYKVGEYKIKTINDKGKERVIMKLPYFPDRIVQWAILNVIGPIFERKFSFFSCSSIKGKGIHYCSRLIRKYLKDRENTKYCLKIDIKKFYPNINKSILKKQLQQLFKEEKLLFLLFKIIDSTPTKKGIPIGSYLSQYLANFYLTALDNYIKHKLKTKYVVRYMDDVAIFGATKDELHYKLKLIKEFLDKELDLKLKENYQIFPTAIRGVDMVGYRHFYDKTLLRKSIYKSLRSKLNHINNKKKLKARDTCIFYSYKGWIKFCNHTGLENKYFNPCEKKINKTKKRGVQ